MRVLILGAVVDFGRLVWANLQTIRRTKAQNTAHNGHGSTLDFGHFKPTSRPALSRALPSKSKPGRVFSKFIAVVFLFLDLRTTENLVVGPFGWSKAFTVSTAC
jgi:hypothetical protein